MSLQLGGDGEEEEEEEKVVVRGTKTRVKLTCGQLLRWCSRLRILWHFRDVTSLVRQADLWKEASSRAHWREMWEAQCFRDCSIGDKQKKRSRQTFHILLMAKKKKRFQISFAPPARPAITPSLTSFIFQSPHSRGWCDDFICHARTHAC